MSKSMYTYICIAAIVIWTIGSVSWYVCISKNLCGDIMSGHTSTQTARYDVPDTLTIQCDSYLDSFVWYGQSNSSASVRKLEQFLNTYYGESLPIDGVFSRHDADAVERFQRQYAEQILHPWGINTPSGHVLDTTQHQINTLHCVYEYIQKTY